MVVQTDWENEEAVAFLQHRLKRLGVDTALERAGAVDGDEMRIVGLLVRVRVGAHGRMPVDVYQGAGHADERAATHRRKRLRGEDRLVHASPPPRVQIDYGLSEPHLADQVARVRAAGMATRSSSRRPPSPAAWRRLGIAKRPHDMPSLQAAASVGQSALSTAYAEAFARARHADVAWCCSRGATRPTARPTCTRGTRFDRLLELGVVPIVNENDTVSVEQIRFGDNDTLGGAGGLPHRRRPHGHPLGHRRAVRREPAPIDPDGARSSAAWSASAADIMAVAGEARHHAWASGGMITKIKAARVLMAAGIPMVICNGARARRLIAAARRRGEDSRHAVRRRRERPHEITAKKLWIALGDAAHGARRRGRRGEGDARGDARQLASVAWACARWKGDFGSDDIVDVRPTRRGTCSRAGAWRWRRRALAAGLRAQPRGAGEQPPAGRAGRPAASSIATNWFYSNRRGP